MASSCRPRRFVRRDAGGGGACRLGRLQERPAVRPWRGRQKRRSREIASGADDQHGGARGRQEGNRRAEQTDFGERNGHPAVAGGNGSRGTESRSAAGHVVQKLFEILRRSADHPGFRPRYRCRRYFALGLRDRPGPGPETGPGVDSRHPGPDGERRHPENRGICDERQGQRHFGDAFPAGRTDGPRRASTIGGMGGRSWPGSRWSSRC